MSDCFYAQDKDQWIASPYTQGPWGAGFQHGGPPSALLGRALEVLLKQTADAQVARVTVELLRPVPIGPLRIRTSVEKKGKKAQLLSATLLFGEDLVARASATCVRRSQIDLPELPKANDAPFLPPERGTDFQYPFFQSEKGYHRAMEMRVVAGEFLKGPISAWMRMRMPLVEAETPSPLQRVLCAADSGNGISCVLDWKRYTFINPELTVHVLRPLEGEWVGLRVESRIDSTGIGLASAGLFGAQGFIGRSAQSLIVEAR